MNIILKDADFSANNVGHVVLHNEYYDAAISNYTGISDSQKEALSAFCSMLYANNLFEKLSYMHIPFLGNNVSKALYNIVDKKTEIDNPSSLTITDGYVHRINDSAPVAKADFDKALSLTDFSFVIMHHSDILTTGGGAYRNFIGTTEILNFFDNVTFASYSNGVATDGTKKDVAGYSFNHGNNTFHFKSYNGNITCNNATIPTDETPCNELYLGSKYDGTLSGVEAQALIILGKSLSEEELQILVDAAGLLATNLGMM